MRDYKQLSGLALVYVGGAIYGVYVRDYLVSLGQTKPNVLHHMATHYASTEARASLMQAMLAGEILTEEREVICKHGRNAKSRTSTKNADVATYRVAADFESLMGRLHLTQQKERLEELINWRIKKVGETNEK